MKIEIAKMTRLVDSIETLSGIKTDPRPFYIVRFRCGDEAVDGELGFYADREGPRPSDLKGFQEGTYWIR